MEGIAGQPSASAMIDEPIPLTWAKSRRALLGAAAAAALALPSAPAARTPMDETSAVVFRSRADAERGSIPAAQRSAGILLLGYYAPHDGGGGWYRFRSTLPPHPATLQARDGSYWELATTSLS